MILQRRRKADVIIRKAAPWTFKLEALSHIRCGDYELISLFIKAHTITKYAQKRQFSRFFVFFIDSMIKSCCFQTF